MGEYYILWILMEFYYRITFIVIQQIIIMGAAFILMTNLNILFKTLALIITMHINKEEFYTLIKLMEV